MAVRSLPRTLNLDVASSDLSIGPPEANKQGTRNAFLQKFWTI